VYRDPMSVLQVFPVSMRSPLAWVAFVAACAVLAPLLALVVLSASTGQQGALSHLLATVLPRYVVNSMLLVLGVSVGVLVMGVGTAWLIAAYRFPGRSWLEVAIILPLAMPAFVMAYAYTDFLDVSGPVQSALRQRFGWAVGDYFFPQVRSLPAAAVLMSLALYPYVYMLARNAFAERSASLSEAARSLGMRGSLVWLRVTYPVARPAIVAGLALVVMETLADFGTVSFFAVDTFSAGIYRAWQGLGDRSAAARLSLCLLLAVLIVLGLERVQRGRMAFHARAMQPARLRRLYGIRAAMASVVCLVPIVLGFLVPTGLLLRAWYSGGAVVDGTRLWAWAGNTAILSGMAVVVIVPVALALAYAVRLVRASWVTGLVAISTMGYAVPGIVLGFGLLMVLGVLDRGLAAVGLSAWLVGGSAVAVVYAYCVRFLAIAQHGLDASLKRISPAMDASARTLGLGPLGVLWRVHWPLLKPSLATAALLVFVDGLKELPATLVLRPFDFDTLAVVAYHFAADERLADAAWPSLMIVLVGLIPVTILARSLRWRGHAP
jgi:iron(III) transport system permease protein